MSIGVIYLPTTEKEILQWYIEMNEGNVAHSEEELIRVRKMLTDVSN